MVLAQSTDPANPLVGPLANLGAIGVLLAFSWRQLQSAETRAKEQQQAALEALREEQAARKAAEADAKALRDVFIKETVPAMAVQQARSEELVLAIREVMSFARTLMNKPGQ